MPQTPEERSEAIQTYAYGATKSRHMRLRAKADWLKKNNPYKQRSLADAWVEGARCFWTGKSAADYGYYLNSRELTAFWKGYEAAEKQESKS